MMRFVFALFAFVPVPAGAQTLWRNVEAGMTTDEVRRLHPARASANRDRTIYPLEERIGPCLSDVWIIHPHGRVTEVRIGEMLRRIGTLSQTRSRCGEIALQLLVGRYGDPDRMVRTVNNAATAADERVWVRNGVAIELRLYGDQQGLWAITYRPAAPGQAQRPAAQPGRTIPGAAAGERGLLIAAHAPTGTEVRLREVGTSIEFVSTSRGGLSASYDIDIDANGRIDPNVDLSYGWLDNGSACASYRLTENSWTGCSLTRSRGRGSREQTGQGRISRWTIPRSEIAPGGRAFGYRVKFYDPRARQNLPGPSGVYRLGSAQRQASSPASSPQSQARPAPSGAQQLWQGLKRDLEATRVEWSSGRVTTYRLTGQPCRSQFTQVRRGGGYEADEESVQVDWARLPGVGTELGSVANYVRLEGSTGFSIQVDSRERAHRIHRAIEGLVQACRAG